MKFLQLITFFLICFASKTYAEENPVVYSKFNYYTSEENAIIILESKDESHKSVQVLYNDQVLATTTFQQLKTKLIVPISNYSEGNYTFQVRVQDAENKQLYAKEIIIKKLKPHFNEVKIDQEFNSLIVDKAPFFPFGFYCGTVGDLPEREVVNGMNMIGPYQGNLPDTFEERKAYMDRCAELGVKVQYGVNSLVSFGHNGDKGLDKTEEEKLAILKQEVLAFKDHPALLSWYLNDEPAGQGRPVEDLEKAKKLIESLDPYHPVSVVFMMPDKAHNYSNAFDIAMTDPYPIPRSVTEVERYVSQLKQSLNHEKSIWMVPQAFGGSEMWPRESTPKEIRVMTYLGILNGARGIQYFIHTGDNLNPQSVSMWNECRNMAVETQQLAPFLLMNEKEEQLDLQNSALKATKYTYHDKEVIMVVNTENELTKVKFQFDEEIKRVSLWFENRNLKITDNVVSDFIDAMDTRVYLLEKNFQNENENNLVYNSSFEKLSTPGLSDGHNLGYTENDYADKGATVFTDFVHAKTGLASLRITTPINNGGKRVNFLPLVTEKGSTYEMAIWAKAKSKDEMPSISLNFKGKDLEHQFQLTEDWKRYSFLFTAEEASTNTIIQLDLLNAGTAWFDDVSLTAEPSVNYTISENGIATVSMKTNLENSNLKYRLLPSKKYKNYKKTIEIDQPTEVEASLWQHKKLIAVSKTFIPINKALYKSVSFLDEPNESYPAKGGSSVTDGLLSSTSFKDENWLGFLQDDVSFVIDLEKETDLSELTLNALCDPNSGIFLPKELIVSVSEDGKRYKELAKKTVNQKSVRGEPYTVPLNINLNTKSRYIKITVKTFGAIPEGYLFVGTNSWFFFDEVLLN
ncbi:Carbohydrate binding domain-containing protein [Pustulibacterium marinum]|uniref:Carbohydrate binding domain-containing protein n=1 Tax=Pustulibacterium marinum TaxID=1224947 RepID=A0A1I7FRP8_9FLAO|nr:carbohydrate binding domain-containing protein [Pustulibacterium marinum]SFU38676.1 Carbohydrate binding domain-containing protein [Pustulibacterium marinum]